jgi:glycosyltransferase involved in cell wall biosynthesis
LFANPELADKVSHIPLGIEARPQLKTAAADDGDTILFTNSWYQGAAGFYVRGGLDVLEAYSRLHSEHAGMRLIIRSKLPEDLPLRYRRIIERCDVQVIDQFLPTSEIEALFRGADIYVLPSARLHVVSILQAMAYGLAIVVSDGWGISEYVDHERNGLIVSGRYGKASWMDGDGMLREDYRPLFSADANMTDGLADALTRLIKHDDTRRTLGEAARKDVETRFSIERWNLGLASAFDKALSA